MTVPFSIRCPNCNTKLTIKKVELIGKRAPCPKCQTKLIIQPPAATAAAPVAAPLTDELPDVGLGKPVEPIDSSKVEPKKAAVKPSKMPVKAAAPKAQVKPKAASAAAAKPKKQKGKRRKPIPDDDFLDDTDDSFDEFDDEFDDDFEDDFDDATPTRKAKGKPTGGRSKKAAAKKKGGGGSKAPIIIAACVLGIGLVGGLTWYFWPNGGDDQTVVANNDNANTADAAATGMHDAMGGGAAGGAATGHDSADAGSTAPNANGNAESAQPGADADTNNASPANNGFDPSSFANASVNSAAAAAPAGPATFDVSYLPVESEVFVRLDVESIYNAQPIQMLLANPAIAENINKVQEQIGVGIADIKSVTIGVPDVMQIAEQVAPLMGMGMGMGGPGGMQRTRPGGGPGMEAGGPPGGRQPGGNLPPGSGFPPGTGLPPGNGFPPGSGFPPGNMGPGGPGGDSPPKDPGVIVIRLKTAVTPAQIQKLEPKFQNSSHAGTAYLRMDGPQSAGIWQPDPMTIVTGGEDNVKKVIDQGSALPTADLSFVNPNANILIAFVPKQPDAIFRANPAVAAQAPPPVKPAIEALVSQTDGVSIGIDLNTDLGLIASVLCKTPAGAEQVHQNVEQLMPLAIAALQQQMKQAPAMQIGYMKMGENLLNSMQFSHTQRHFHLAGKSDKAGTSLATQASLMIPMMLPAITQARGAARRTQSKNNLKEIALAMLNSHDVYRKYPDLANKDEDSGKPLLSWRVHMLPYLEQQALYEQFHLNEPWDSPHNKTLIDKIPTVYVSPSAELDPGQTIYLAVTGPGTVFEDGKGRSLRDITDGSSDTILVVEADQDAAVVWTQPGDFTLDASNIWTGIGSTYENGFQAVFADGHVSFVSQDTNVDFIKAMFTRGNADAVR